MCTSAVLIGVLLLPITLSVPLDKVGLFIALLAVTALFVPMAAPNGISTVYDITLPEVRSSAMALQSFIEGAGAALAPLVAGPIAMRFSLRAAILILCVSAWIVCAVFFGVATFLVPRDIRILHGQLRQRAEEERARQGAV